MFLFRSDQGPSHKSEMLSQVLFGEKYKILDQSGHWFKVVTLFRQVPGMD